MSAGLPDQMSAGLPDPVNAGLPVAAQYVVEQRGMLVGIDDMRVFVT